MNQELVEYGSKLGWTAFGYSIKRLREWYELRDVRRVWSPFLGSKEPIGVVLSTRPGPHLRSTPRLSLNEMLAFSELNILFHSVGKKVVPRPSDTDLSTLAKENIVVLGGPNANDVAKDLWKLLEPRLPVAFDGPAVQFTVANRAYKPEYDAAGLVTRDFGVVLRTSNPLFGAEGKRLLMAFGCHGYATYAVLSSALQKSFARRVHETVGSKDFVAVLDVRLKGKAVVQAEVITCMSL